MLKWGNMVGFRRAFAEHLWLLAAVRSFMKGFRRTFVDGDLCVLFKGSRRMFVKVLAEDLWKIPKVLAECFIRRGPMKSGPRRMIWPNLLTQDSPTQGLTIYVDFNILVRQWVAGLRIWCTLHTAIFDDWTMFWTNIQCLWIQISTIADLICENCSPYSNDTSCAVGWLRECRRV